MKHYAYNSPFKMKDDEGNEYTLTVEYYDLADDPREWDNLCTMVCWHRRYYYLGDKHGYDNSDEFFNDILYSICDYNPDYLEDLSTRDKYKLACKNDQLYIKPINLYEHGGLTVSTSSGYPYNDRWDSCCVGFIYVTKKKIFDQCLDATDDNWKDLADKYMESEMEIYDQYLQGEVYRFKLEQQVKIQDLCPHCGEVIKEYYDMEYIDGCSGFYGDCLEENGIFDNLPVGIKFVED